jgi:hypothetical protein
MQKAHSPSTEGALRLKPIGLILPQSPTENQASTKEECQIFDLIQQHRLTDSIECLESCGYRTDDALRMIAYLQLEGVKEVQDV